MARAYSEGVYDVTGPNGKVNKLQVLRPRVVQALLYIVCIYKAGAIERGTRPDGGAPGSPCAQTFSIMRERERRLQSRESERERPCVGIVCWAKISFCQKFPA